MHLYTSDGDPEGTANPFESFFAQGTDKRMKFRFFHRLDMIEINR
jgi:hypothetical protein